MRNFKCPLCQKNILEEFEPNKSWFVFGINNDCQNHEALEQFDSSKNAYDYISKHASEYNVRFVSQK